MRQTGVIMCGNDTFHDSEQSGCTREEGREEGVRSRRRGLECAPHLPPDCRSASVSEEEEEEVAVATGHGLLQGRSQMHLS